VSPFPPLAEGETTLSDSTEVLLRSVHPSWVDQGKPTSLAFKPTGKDAGCLSVARSTVVTPQEHFDEFTGHLGLSSDGIWGVSVDEVQSASSRAIDDQLSSSRPDPCPRGHSYVDYRDLDTGGAIKSRARVLLAAAVYRGPLFDKSDAGSLIPKSAAS
jgi:hypothetical protein